MEATVNYLWDTYRKIISFNNSEFDCPTSITELKKCDNVLVGTKVCKGGPYEVMIDDHIYFVSPIKLSHPSGGGSLRVLEIN